MDWTRDIQDALAAPFAPEEVEFVPSATSGERALAVPYLEAKSVMRRLDAVVGVGGWEFRFDPLTPDCKKVRGTLTVLGVTRQDAGEADKESEPLKAAVTDAIKRCGVLFGIGRYLAYVEGVWVAYDPAKRRVTETPRLNPDAVKRALAICGYHGAVPDRTAAAAQQQASTARQPSPGRQRAEQAVRNQERPAGEALGIGGADVAKAEMRAANDAVRAACAHAKLSTDLEFLSRIVAVAFHPTRQAYTDLPAEGRRALAEYVIASPEECRSIWDAMEEERREQPETLPLGDGGVETPAQMRGA